MKKLYFAFALALTASNFYAQEDAEGCKDHPFFNRMPNFRIESCPGNYNAVDLPIANGKKKHVEGNMTTIAYVFNDESNAKKPSPLQIMKNYENAIVSKGGKKVFQGVTEDDGNIAVFNLSANGKDYWVSVSKMYEPQGGGEVGGYGVMIVEMEAMKQDVEASEMFKEISASGRIALYINFETGKADIKSESQKTVDQIAQMMKDNPTLKVSIEGHTDNAGNAAANQTLSDNRAKSVMNAVTAKGIDKARMTSKGWGQTKPLADNGTEDGKAKNRRVEIVKQ
ncbi:MAG: OmpA/MotB domain protein [Bacteroidetes bacterium]|jgi:outer membrane protein OmpA-like peptidoglycan-associated protein|nr:OmpA/MotB domain protein [Bacteroidota bacterium]